MKIYIAGKFEEHVLIARYAEKLENRGHEITFPWFRRHVVGGISLQQSAEEDVYGVRDSDACVFVFERDLVYKGAYAELGMAVALEKRILVVGHAADSCIFMNLPQVERVETLDEVLEVLRGG